MKLPHRRRFLHLAAGAAALPAVTRIARADTYPTRPVHWVVTSAAGGSGDIIARLMGRWLSDRLGQPFIIDNRPGAGVNIGTEAVVRAPADGYTLLIINKGNVASELLYSPPYLQRQFPSLSPMPKLIPPRSTWHPPELELTLIWLASYS
jgi:tripartite-type tricarboxylate transporter receptor subunit TctC